MSEGLPDQAKLGLTAEGEGREGQCPKCRARMTGRHCLACGWSRAERHPEHPEVALRGFRKSVGPEPEDGQKFIDLLKQYNLTIPKNAIEWRVGPKEQGEIPSLNLLSVRVLCTDGIVAWFLLGDGETTFFGHLDNWKKDRAAGEDSPSGKKKRSPRKSAMSAALELLQ